MGEITQFVSKAWKAYKKNVWSILIALILVNAIALIPLGIGILTTPLLLFSFPTFASLENLLASSTTLITGILLTWILSTLFRVSMLAFYQETLKKRARIKTIFLTLKRFWLEILVLNLIVGLILIAIFGLLEVPALFFTKTNLKVAITWFLVALIPFFLISTFFTFSNFYLILKKRRILESIGRSVRLVRKNYLQVLALVAIFAILGGLISLIPYVGSLLTFFLIEPLQALTFVAYFSRKG